MDKKNLTYHEQKSIKYTLQLRELLSNFPSYTTDYFRSKSTSTSPRTQISYAYDLRVFFRFLLKNNPLLSQKTMAQISLDDLDQVTSFDIEEYQEFLKYYKLDTEQTNTPISIARKMSSLRSFYSYFFRRKLLKSNPTLQVDMPKINKKAIIYLEPDEIVTLLDSIESYGQCLTAHKRSYYEKTKLRDLAIITLLLGTGIRVSECVGLDLKDINFHKNSLRIIRKGGNEAILYFGKEVEIALHNYINSSRANIQALKGHENALFFSSQKKRMSVHAIENMVAKYTKEFIAQKKITPHKLRSSYGTNLYEKTSDIYLVADVLGHSDVNTTKKYYAHLKEERRRFAASAVKLREK